MEQFLRALAGFRRESSLERFAQSVALNVARNYLRRQVLTTRIFDLFTEPMDKPSAIAPQDSAAYEKEIFSRIMDHLNRIAVKKRIVFCMYYFESKTLAEISEELGANPETVKVRLFHARKELLRLGMKDPCIKEWLGKAQEDGHQP
jgi:RNA polymerase sigma-70 factor (ECF subfamily)